MPALRPSKIFDYEWEEQKSMIERLFLRERRSLPDDHNQEGVISYMSRERNFTATLSQYEARLKHWNFRKNINTKDWIEIARIIEKREAQEKRSAVFVSGALLEDSQVVKGVSRPAVRDALRDSGQEGLLHDLPIYVEVRTPPLDPHSDGHQSQPSSYSLESSNSHGQEHVAEGASTILDYAPSSQLDLARDFNDTDEVSYTLSEKLPDSETQLVDCSSISPHAYLLSLQESGSCASPILAGGRDRWIQDCVRHRLKSQIQDTFSLISKLQPGRNLPFVPAVFVKELYQQSMQEILPVRSSYNLGHTAQSVNFLQIAVLELVNGDFRRRETSLPVFNPYDGQRIDPNYSRPVLWALSYFQQSSLMSFDKLRKLLPPSFLALVLRNLFVVALEAHAYNVLEYILLSSTTSSNMFHTAANNLSQNLSRVIGDGPMSLAALIMTHFGERAIDWSVLSLNLNVRPVNKLSYLMSQNIQPEWRTLLPGLTLSRDTREIHESVMKFRVWEYAPCFFLTQELIRGLILRTPEADALWGVETILKGAQPTILHWLTHPTESPLEEEDFPKSKKRDILALAVARSFDTVVNLLINAGFEATSNCLYEALRLKRMDFVERLLNHGSSPWNVVDAINPYYLTPVLVSTIDVDLSGGVKATTPYAEAVRLKLDDALHLFDKTLFQVTAGPMISKEIYAILFAASETGNETVLRQFLRHRLESPPDMPSSEDWFPYLTHAVKKAAENGHVNVMTLLFQSGIPPSFEIFESAIRLQNKDMVVKLFESDMKYMDLYSEISSVITSTNSGYHDVVLAAIECGNQDILSVVLDCVDLRKTGYPGDFLKAAIIQENPTLVQDLIQRGVHPNASVDWSTDEEGLESVLIVAIRKRNKQIVTLLLDEHAWTGPQFTDYNVFPCTQNERRCVSALEAAARIVDTDLIEELLHRGAEPCDSRAILLLDAARDWVSLDNLLCKADEQSLTIKTGLLWHALVTAVDCTNYALLHRLLRHVDQNVMFNSGADELTKDCVKRKWAGKRFHEFDASRLSILSVAMHKYDQKRCPLEMVCSLLDSGSDAEAICFETFHHHYKFGEMITSAWTPLQHAVLLSSNDCVDLLMKFGADINRDATNHTNRTALQLAVEIEDVKMVSYLISKGALVNAPPAPRKGLTALQLAAKHGFHRIAEILIDAKADVDAPRAKVGGRTAFEAATENGRLAMMGLLVKNGALTIDGEQQYGRAVELAKAKGQDPAVEYAGQLRAKLLEATRTAEREFQDLMEYPMPGLDT